ncbi:AraC family transcriptional regulator [Companilactobacillus sp. HBUAS59544]|uniref:AraC family transcriptional regulator n=1 Tax=Companilactobacillus sp. HBUAS59544 TaxID=3109363 RepID=UPI002FF0B54A
MNLDDLLRTLNPVEKRELEKHDFINDFPQKEKRILNGHYHLNNEIFFKNNSIYISKQFRFASYPTHSHQFLELNYMYSGTCREVVNGKELYLKKNDILLLDTGSRHKIDPLGENDILINFLFKRSDLSLNFLNNFNQQFSPSFEFIMNAAMDGDDNNHENFMYLHNQNSSLPTIFNNVMNEYFFPKAFSNQIIKNYIPIIFFELARDINTQIEHDNIVNKEIIYPILKIIEENYATITVAKIADTLNYSRNYISNLIKEKTNKTFSQLQTEQRMQHAYDYLENTDLPIGSIIEAIGMTNRSNFYKKFELFYHQKPNDIRKKNKISD